MNFYGVIYMSSEFRPFEISDLREETISSQNVYDGKLLHVKCDSVRLPGGNTSTREFIRHVGAVCVVAVTDDERVVVERQYRYPMDEVILEIPAGKLDSKSEDPLIAARRELMEETGVTAENMEYMGKYYPTCGYSDEVIHMYLATGLTFGERRLDEDEFLNVELMPLCELVSMIMDGKVPDGKTQAAVMRVYCRLRGKNA